jgi:hypothetical protein
MQMMAVVGIQPPATVTHGDARQLFPRESPAMLQDDPRTADDPRERDEDPRERDRTDPRDVFPQYARHTLTALMIELELHTRDQDVAEVMRKLRRELERLNRSLNWKVPNRDDSKATLDALEEFQIAWYNALNKIGYRGDLESNKDGRPFAEPDFPGESFVPQ